MWALAAWKGTGGVGDGDGDGGRRGLATNEMKQNDAG
jgi:hypothetical protein